MPYELILISSMDLETNLELKALLFCQQITMNIKEKTGRHKTTNGEGT